MDKFAQQFESAFWDELEKIGALNRLDGLRDNPMVKEALPAIAQTAMQGLGRAAGAVRQGAGQVASAVGQGARQLGTGIQHAAVGRVIPTGVAGNHGKELMLRKGGLFGGLMGTGRKMEEAGMAMRQTAAQRVAAAPGLSAAGRLTSPQQMQEIQQAAKAMGRSDPGAARRIGSHMVESTGHHIEHASPAALAFKSVGVPLGGALEGFSRGAGRELQQVGAKPLQSLGRGMETHAKTVGRVGEYVGVPAMAMAAHAPLGAAGLIGGKLLGVAGHAVAPGVEAALHHAGDIGQYAHHAISDVAGEGARRITGAAGNLAAQRGGRLGAVGSAVAGAAS